MHPKSAGGREGFEWSLSQFLEEARTLARFEHPNVVRVRDTTRRPAMPSKTCGVRQASTVTTGAAERLRPLNVRRPSH